MSLRARATEKKKIPKKNSQVKEAAHVIERESYQEKNYPKKNGHERSALMSLRSALMSLR